MEKDLQAKRKHHYVWANYLLRWSTNSRDIFCVTSKGNIDFTSVRGLVMEKDFYQLTSLEQKHIDAILMFSSGSPAKLQEMHQSYLRDFLKVQKLESAYKNAKKQSDEAEQAILASKCNLVENLHTAHENAAKNIIENLAQGKMEILKNDQDMVLFSMYLGHQMARTKNFKVRCITGVKECNPELGKIMEHSWWFFSYMFGMNMGLSFYSNRHNENHTLLKNNTNSNFITSDQPAINVHSCVKDDEFQAPDNMDLYYPISPKYSYIITESHRFESGLIEVDESVVTEFNKKIATNANNHIFALRKQDADTYKSFVGGALRKIK
ncbi:DUF4238 domain-containing protein [Psychrobacter sp. CAM01]|uniref:DUF4238 domain-containing protein n=1 Tax=Psychrobacter sp. CAM01 TaxID=3080335 RepID=UPI002935999A|nr:DUF4238 domain-containing protein [Psychrobacter sp. CAM01]MDV2860730.1 DUF4238 domain-containing protein [Psychrobacter sp. CAM01]